ncbi:MAG: hypothetical protein EU547_04065 [Promethearchaeota archaeon]|nr:MAG: hypothetical protein EU547_04065 [Candidatus Lokiarchaeota archaeon]
MRIDKIIKGGGAYIILPDFKKLNEICFELKLNINFKKFFITGIKNLIKFANEKNVEMYNKALNKEKIIIWFENTKEIEANLPSFREDNTFLITEFLKFYDKIVNNNGMNDTKYYIDQQELILNYLEKNIEYIQNRIDNNLTKIERDNKIINEEICFQKRKKIFPRIINLDIEYKNEKHQMKFVPYLIYEDLLEIFLYNMELIKNKEISKLGVDCYNRIINKRSNISHLDNLEELDKFSLENIKIEDLL